ncbi:MAG: hypothetical protein HRU22_15945 [Gammaproteobacteria bacterium]|nr:hypothetical protein [Gammaproteobacteria bacterium]
MKNNLEAHILRCSKVLELLVSDSITPEHQTEVNLILDLIKYEKSQTIACMGEERNFIELINGVPSVAIQGYNKNRELIYWNKASELIYGYTFSEAIGKRLEQLIIPEAMQSVVVAGINNWFSKGIAIPAGE